MTSLRNLGALGAVVLALLALLPPRYSGAQAHTDERPLAEEGAGGPVVLELFTSQGCSSCPPADRVLSELAAGDDVIALSFHVDYWNYIGWTDPFSSAEWSERQRDYARALRTGRVYTPMVVVDGRTDLVGSQRHEVEELVADARRRQRAGSVELMARPGEASLAVSLAAEVDAGRIDGPVDLLLAVVESGLETPVKRGENARRTLHNDCVVRRLQKLGTLGPDRTSLELDHRIELDPAWNSENLSLVGLLQDPETLAIHGAGRCSVGDVD